MNGDVFTNNKSNPVRREETDNFFLNSPDKFYSLSGSASKRLNDYDYNILSDEAYKEVKDEVFRLEYKISTAEEELKNLETQIKTAEAVNDTELLSSLTERKLQKEEELSSLLEIYKTKSLSAKISGKLSEVIGAGENFRGIKNWFSNLRNFIIKNLPSNIGAVIELRKSLNKLENISRSVDELMSMQAPYGESAQKYEQLSRFITKANAIQSEISKHLR